MQVNKNLIIYFIFGEKLCSIYDVDISLIIISHSSNHRGATSSVMEWCHDSFTPNRNNRNTLGTPCVYCACTMKSCFTHLYPSPLGTQMKSISVQRCWWKGVRRDNDFCSPTGAGSCVSQATGSL